MIKFVQTVTFLFDFYNNKMFAHHFIVISCLVAVCVCVLMHYVETEHVMNEYFISPSTSDTPTRDEEGREIERNVVDVRIFSFIELFHRKNNHNEPCNGYFISSAWELPLCRCV